MEATAVRTRLVSIGIVFLAAAPFAWVAVVNGYPLVFNDSARYIAGGILRYIPSEAPIFYGIFMIPFHLDGFSLWPVVGAQSLILAYSLRATLRALDIFEVRTFLALSLCLALFTGASWFTSFLMPDFFTPVCALVMFSLFRGWEKFPRIERLFLVGLALIALSSHVTNVVLGLTLVALFGVLHLFGDRSRRDAVLTLLALPPVALGAIVGMNVIAKHRAEITRDGPVFLLARAFADGPAYEYLRDHCGERHWRLCSAYQDLPRNAEEFLWRPRGSVWSVGSQDEVRAEASEIVAGALREHPTQMAVAALRNALEQLVTFRTGVDFRSWPGGNGDSSIAAAIHRFFPREAGEYFGSLQQQGRLGTRVANDTYSLIIILSIVGMIALLPRTRFDAGLAEFLLVVAVALVMNAATTGALSMVASRYQARIVWLLPLAFGVSVLFFQRRRETRMALSANRSIEGNA